MLYWDACLQADALKGLDRRVEGGSGISLYPDNYKSLTVNYGYSRSTIKTAGVRGQSARGIKQMPIPDYFIGGQSRYQFDGLVTALTDPKKPVPGSYIDGKNWLTGQLQDHIELRGGSLGIGTQINAPSRCAALAWGFYPMARLYCSAPGITKWNGAT